MKKEIIEQISSELSSCEQFVDQSFPSVYTKQDVLQLLVKFADTISKYVLEQEEASPKLSLEGIEELSTLLMRNITTEIDRLDSEDVVEFDSASFSIGYNNQVEIDSIDYVSDGIISKVEEAVDEVLHDFFTLEEEESNPQEVIFETPYATEQ